MPFKNEDFDAEAAAREFGERLKKIREGLGYSQRFLAAQVGTSPTAIQNYEKGQLPKGDQLAKLVLTLGCSADHLLFGGGAGRPSGKFGAVIYRESNDIIFLPLVRARLSAGDGSLECDAAVQAHYAFRRDWVWQRGNPQNMVLMKVTGDSMEPELKDGDMVLIDQAQRDVIAGGYYAVGIEDAVMVKQLDSIPGKLILRSLNAAYTPVEVDLRGDLADGVRIIGRVIWWCREAR